MDKENKFEQGTAALKNKAARFRNAKEGVVSKSLLPLISMAEKGHVA